MARIRLLQAVCTVAMLAAVPALAQRPEAGMTGPNGQPNPVDQQPAPNNNTSSMAPANSGTGGTGSQASMEHSTHRSAMAHSRHAMHGQHNGSQDAAVDQLNEQSYQAAQKGQTFSASSTNNGPGGMTAPSDTGNQNGMSGGSMSGSGPAGAGSTGSGGKM